MERSSSIPRFWNCSTRQCCRAAVIDSGACERCMQFYCSFHIISSSHGCSEEPLDDKTWAEAQMRELVLLREKVCDEALLQIASTCNRGMRCSLDMTDPLGKSLMGGMHVHLRIIFDDGTKWLARILRQNFTSFSDDVSNNVLISECATLRWLESIDIPSPKLHSYGLRSDPTNDVGVAYMLMDEMAGSPYLYLLPSADEQQKVCGQLAQIQSILYQHPLEQIGCLTLQPDNSIVIGPIVGDRTGTMHKIGPFGDAPEYYADWAEHYLQLISDGQLYIGYSVNAYLIFKYLKLAAEEGKWSSFESELDKGPFFLKHMDDKGDHILVDKDFNITGIIDWSFARAVPIYEAFGPSLFTASLGDLLEGRLGQTDFDKKLIQALREVDSPLVRFASAPDIVRRLSFGLGMGMNLTWDEARILFAGICKAIRQDNIDADWDKWKQEHLELWYDDNRLRKILAQGTT